MENSTQNAQNQEVKKLKSLHTDSNLDHRRLDPLIELHSGLENFFTCIADGYLYNVSIGTLKEHLENLVDLIGYGEIRNPEYKQNLTDALDAAVLKLKESHKVI